MVLHEAKMKILAYRRKTGVGTTKHTVSFASRPRTFRHFADGHDVSNLKLCRLSAVDELTGRDTLDSDEKFLHLPVLVLVTELNLGERGSTSRVMDDLLDEALHVPGTLGIVGRAQGDGTFAVLRLRLEDAPGPYAGRE